MDLFPPQNESYNPKLKVPSLKLRLLLAAFPFLWYLPSIIKQFQYAGDPHFIGKECVILFQYFRLTDPQLFPGDYITDYLCTFSNPWGFNMLQQLWYSYGDIYLLHNYMHFPLWGIMLACIGRSAWRLGGPYLCFASLVLTLGASHFLHQLIGGMEHAFGLPIAALAVLSAVEGKAVYSYLSWALAALFYPAIIPYPLFSLCAVALLPGAAPGRQSTTDARVFKFVILQAIVLGVLSIFLILPHVQPISGYGEPISQSVDNDLYPEAGSSGRNFLAVRTPGLYFLGSLLRQFHQPIGVGQGLLILGFQFLLLILAFAWRDRLSAPMTRFSIFFVECFAFLGIVWVFLPSTAYRFLIYVFPVMFTLVVPLGALFMLSRWVQPKIGSGPCLAAAVLLYSFILNPGSSYYSGYDLQLSDDQLKAYEFLSTTPPDSLIAGLPGWNGDSNILLIEYVPYLTKRAAFLSWKTHIPSYRKYTLEMRDRMNALIEAYYALELAPLRKLRDAWGVDYLIVNEQVLSAPPDYFEPFAGKIKQMGAKAQSEGGAIIRSLARDGAVFRSGPISIIDLHTIPSSPPANQKPASLS